MFKTGVPQHRLGERERLQFAAFEQLLNEKADITVIMGDLFDKFNVPAEVTIATAIALVKAAAADPAKMIVILKGNHDLARDGTKRSSFDLLTHIVRATNVIFVDQVREFTYGDLRFLAVPYNAFYMGEEVLDDFIENQWDQRRYDFTVGHWDLDIIAGKTPHNLIPVEQLRKLCRHAYTGHVHVPEIRDYEAEAGESPFTIYCTGSMQPYSFAEDPKQEIYITEDLRRFERMKDHSMFKDKCLRLIMVPEETLPEVDCLQLVPKFIGREDIEDLQVELLDFDLEKLFTDCMSEFGVTHPGVIEEVRTLFHNARENIKR